MLYTPSMSLVKIISSTRLFAANCVIAAEGSWEERAYIYLSAYEILSHKEKIWESRQQKASLSFILILKW